MQDVVGANCDGRAGDAVESFDPDGREETDDARCPTCGRALVEETYYAGVTVAVCPRCR